MSVYRAYAEYKETTADWLGAVPKHWKVIQIKHLTAVRRGASPRPIDDPKYFDSEGEFAWVRIADVSASERYLESTTQRLSEIGENLSVKMLPNDLFLSIAGTVGKPIITRIKCCIHDGFVYFPDFKENKEFLYYVFACGQPYLGLGKMGTQLNLNTDTVGSISIGLPPLREQAAIVDFLDYKTAQIDALIAKKQALLETLAEKRTALISYAVTKGLDPSVPMKDSGVAWLGEIPQHWQTKRLRFLTTMAGGMTPSTGTPEYWNGDVPWVSPKDMKSDELSFSIDTLTEKAVSDTGIRLHDSGRVLIVVRGMILAHTFPVAVNTVPVTVNQDMKALSSSLNHGYLALLLRGIQGLILSVVEESAHGTKVLRTDVFKNIFLPVPPDDEQKRIVQEVCRLTKLLDEQGKTVHSVIDRLNEYRSALITNAVTGKIDVRNFEIPQSAEESAHA
jgi:type I restriction enzyme S subunit